MKAENDGPWQTGSMPWLTLNQFRIMNIGVWLGYLVLTTNFLSVEWAGAAPTSSQQ